MVWVCVHSNGMASATRKDAAQVASPFFNTIQEQAMHKYVDDLDRVQQLIEADPGTTVNKMTELLDRPRVAIATAAAWLVDLNQVTRVRKCRTFYYYPLEKEDPNELTLRNANKSTHKKLDANHRRNGV